MDDLFKIMDLFIASVNNRFMLHLGLFLSGFIIFDCLAQVGQLLHAFVALTGEHKITLAHQHLVSTNIFYLFLASVNVWVELRKCNHNSLIHVLHLCHMWKQCTLNTNSIRRRRVRDPFDIYRYHRYIEIIYFCLRCVCRFLYLLKLIIMHVLNALSKRAHALYGIHCYPRCECLLDFFLGFVKLRAFWLNFRLKYIKLRLQLSDITMNMTVIYGLYFISLDSRRHHLQLDSAVQKELLLSLHQLRYCLNKIAWVV